MGFLDGVPPLYLEQVQPNIDRFYDEGVTEFRSSPETSDRVQKRSHSLSRRELGLKNSEHLKDDGGNSIPSPVYPRSVSQERKLTPEIFLAKPRGVTRDEIISRFCDGDVAL